MALASSISRRYATALIDAATAAGDGVVEKVAEEMGRFGELFHAAPDVANVLSNPVFTAAEKEKALGLIMDTYAMTDITRRFLKLLLDRRRISGAPQIARAVRRLADERARRVRAQVETAAPLTPDAAESLRRALEKRTGKRVEMDVAVNPALLGGVRARIGSTVLDGTLRSQLEYLKDALARAD